MRPAQRKLLLSDLKGMLLQPRYKHGVTVLRVIVRGGAGLHFRGSLPGTTRPKRRGSKGGLP